MILSADLLIHGAIILCMDEQMQVLYGHSIAILNGKIAAIYPTSEMLWEAKKNIDAADCIVIPGLINAHTHLPMTYFRGLADDLPLEKWLQGFIWPLEAKLIKPAFVYDASLHGAAEMLKAGIVCASDMYFHGREIALAVSKAGMRAIIGEAVIQMKLSDNGGINSIGKAALELKAEFIDNPLVEFAITPHSIYACERETLEKCAEVAISHDMLLHIHLAETPFEREFSQKNYGKKPVEFLDEISVLKARTLLAHAIWVDAEEMDLIRENDCSVVTCLESNLKLCSGIFPMQKYLHKGVNVCMGTDGVASNNNLDLFSEMDMNAKLHKQNSGDPSFLPASEVLKMATINAAKALGMGDLSGSIEVGKFADLAILSISELHCQPIYNPYSHIVYAMNQSNVRDVIVNGEIVVQNRILCRLDEAELIATAKAYQARIKSEL